MLATQVTQKNKFFILYLQLLHVWDIFQKKKIFK